MLAPISMNRLLALSEIPASDISENARAMARMSLFDWLTVSRAGSNQPLARIMRNLVAAEGGEPAATVVGLAQRVPSAAERADMNAIIFDELVRGTFLDASRARVVGMIEKLQREGCDAVALSCTEIPLLLRETHVPVPTFDTMALHIRAAVAFALG